MMKYNTNKNDEKPKTNRKRKSVKNVIENKPIENKPIENKPFNVRPISIKDNYSAYLKDKDPFRIYLNGQVIYDSDKQKMNIEFLEDYFILGDSKYEYKAIKVEKYKK